MLHVTLKALFRTLLLMMCIYTAHTFDVDGFDDGCDNVVSIAVNCTVSCFTSVLSTILYLNV